MTALLERDERARMTGTTRARKVIAVYRAGGIVAVENTLVSQKGFGRRGVTLVTAFAPDTVATMGGTIPVLQVIRVGIRLRIREVAIGTTTILRLAGSTRDRAQTEHQQEHDSRQSELLHILVIS